MLIDSTVKVGMASAFITIFKPTSVDDVHLYISHELVINAILLRHISSISVHTWHVLNRQKTTYNFLLAFLRIMQCGSESLEMCTYSICFRAFKQK